MSLADPSPLRRVSARELLLEVLDYECAELPDEFKKSLLDLADHSNSGRYSRIKDLIQGAARD